ncbi:MAG: hypothetical protein GTO45_16800 [Candidatus Aminicenantes bacterium]|nr:hypothetical protein [Candidatus Aminicenantes bacterium]NIM80401.1 hypothetical protein [Candidatus Aminicenantes bacterium]NIN19788.1 hypothetical protein [Candidatus Aminicenantes bacterium]NIN43670.1 hypothetical protein [Candidatus Aminicenantes bacterium]NIN86415.1 hypothetical protein [Candidatus Aminicenantes bacterium]
MNRGTPLKIFVASGSELINECWETIQVVHELRKVFPSLYLVKSAGQKINCSETEDSQLVNL